MRKAVAFIVLLVLFSAPLVKACMSPADSYAVEVVLNKPGIVYRPYPTFNALHNAIVENGTFIFRSHYDERLIVMLWNASDGPHLRVQIPAEVVASVTFNASLLVTASAIEKLKAGGWKEIANMTFTRDNITIALKPVAGSECNSDRDCATGGCSGEVCAPRNEAAKIVTPCVYKPWYECFSLTSCGCVNGFCTWKPNGDFKSCLRKHGVDPSQVIRAGLVEVEAEARGVGPDELKAAVGEFLSAFGVDCLPLSDPAISPQVEIAPVIDPSEVNLSVAVKTELEWLREVGVLQISDEDIGAITRVAGSGKAGWNSHIGWYETKNGTYAWIPYDESKDPSLVRCTSPVVPAYDLPNGTAYVGPTATQPPSTDTTTSTNGSPSGEICGPALMVGLSLVVLLWKR